MLICIAHTQIRPLVATAGARRGRHRQRVGNPAGRGRHMSARVRVRGGREYGGHDANERAHARECERRGRRAVRRDEHVHEIGDLQKVWGKRAVSARAIRFNQRQNETYDAGAVIFRRVSGRLGGRT